MARSIILSPASQQRIDQFLARPSHGILLDGIVGVGLKTIALYIADHLRANPDEIQHVSPDEKGTITIERIRTLYALTRASHDKARVVIIDDAEAMGIPAQNALLKLLEEPTDRTYFILTSHMHQILLPTITSRLQRISISPLSAAMSESLITEQDGGKRAQIAFLGSGRPAELYRLQHDEKHFTEATQLMKDARAFLGGGEYERLVLTKTYSTNRVVAEQFLISLMHLLKFMLFRQKNPDHARNLELIDTVLSRVAANGHIKTQLTYLVTKLN